MAAEIKIVSIKEHMKMRSMWGGALTRCDIPNIPCLSADYKSAAPATRLHTPRLIQMFKELISNAADAVLDGGSQIVINFDQKTLGFQIINDGREIPVVIHEQASKQLGRTVYTPEVVMYVPLSGSNFDTSTENYHAGTNGLGCKLCTFHSKTAMMEVQNKNGMWLRKIVTDCGDDDSKPPEVKNNGTAASFVRVLIKPDYAKLGYTPADERDIEEIAGIIRFIAVSIAISYRGKIKVSFNGAPVPITDVGALAVVTADGVRGDVKCEVFRSEMKMKNGHNWEYAVIVFDIAGKGIASMRNIGIINNTIGKVPHVEVIREKLRETAEKIYQKITRSDEKMSLKALDIVRIVACGFHPNCQWDGQCKDTIQVPSMKDVAAASQFDAKFMNMIANYIIDHVMNKKKRKSKRKIAHFEKAIFADGKRSDECVAMLVEGESAATFVRRGLASNTGLEKQDGTNVIVPDKYHCSIYQLGGVIMNAIRTTGEHTSERTGEKVLVPFPKFKQSAKMTDLTEALGLDYSKKYDTPAELATLRHRRFIFVVDQDLDGIGKVMPLGLVYFYRFWPKLFEHGLIGMINTPVIKCYYKGPGEGKDETFYYEHDFEMWRRRLGAETKKYKVEYYKGLASNPVDEIPAMFVPKVFNQSVYYFKLEPSDVALLDVYYGNCSQGRKIELSTPAAEITEDEEAKMRTTCRIPMELQLRKRSKPYKLNALSQQLPSIVSGLTICKTKILCALLGRKAKMMKVFQLGGLVANKMAYHHGDMSLNKSITAMVRCYQGQNEIPLLIGHGEFGTRHGAGKDAGSPRYISAGISPAAEAIFPAADMPVLETRIIDDAPAEKTYLVPVLPMNIIGSKSNPSEAWRHQSFGRDLASVLRLLNAMLTGKADELVKIAENIETPEGAAAVEKYLASRVERKLPDLLPISRYKFTGEIKIISGVEYSYGKYEYVERENTIYVTELPYGIPTTRHFTKLFDDPDEDGDKSRADYIKSWDDLSKPETIDVRVRLKPGKMEQIMREFKRIAKPKADEPKADESKIVAAPEVKTDESKDDDPIRNFLGLRTTLHKFLTYMNRRGSFIECRNYLHPFLYWFNVRRQTYLLRIRREEMLQRVEIIKQKNILRYITEAKDIKIAEMTDSEVEKELRRREYQCLDLSALKKPGNYTTEALWDLVTRGPEATCSYLVRNRISILSVTGKAAREKKLRELEDKLIATGKLLEEKPFAGVSVWRSEVARAVAKVQEGMSLNWLYRAGKKKGGTAPVAEAEPAKKADSDASDESDDE